MAEPLQALLGIPVLLAPGLALTWALYGAEDWAKFFAVSVIAALTVPPLALYVLNVFFGVAFAPLNLILLCLALASLGLALGVRPRLRLLT